MLKVGITGGIGSGKSTVAKIFSGLKIPVLDADQTAKDLMENDPNLRQQLTQTFGSESYQNGRLNRPFLAKAVFDNPEKLALLNQLVHPVVMAYSNEWAARQTAPYVLKEAALFFESGSDKDIDYMIGVSAPEALRIERVQQRNGWSVAEIKARIAGQMNEAEKMERCDTVIINDGQHSLIEQVLLCHQRLLVLSQTKNRK